MNKFSFVRTAIITASLVVGANTASAMQNHSHTNHSPKEVAGQTVHHGKGQINSISEDRTINMTHGPIEPLGMPGMRMSFKVADTVGVSQFNTGDTVAFNLIEGDGGWFVIVNMTKT